ncbi:MAG: hypothetical protein OHK0053_35830 [Microscillaceae bacterium]
MQERLFFSTLAGTQAGVFYLGLDAEKWGKLRQLLLKLNKLGTQFGILCL